MDVEGSRNRLLKSVLSWDYFELTKRVDETVTRKLNPVPDVFDSVEVR